MSKAETKTAKKNGKFMATGGEHFSYGLYFFGQNIFYILIYMYLSTFFTDVGIPALTVAGIALVVKIWDAINDPIFGGFVDKIRFKKGKFVPWLRISLFFIPLASIFMFAIPSSMPLGVKVVWAVIAYMLWDTAYTVCDVPIFGLVTTITDRQEERTLLQAIGRVAAIIAAVIVSIVIPSVRTAIGGWLPTVIVLSIMAFITMVPICLKAKERIETARSEKEVGLKEMFSYLVHNKYLFIFFGALFINSACNIGTTLSLYVARHCFENEGIATMLGLVAIIPAIIMGMFVPALCKRVDKFYLFFWSNVAMAIMTLVVYFAGYQNFTLFLILTLIRAIPLGISTVVMFMFTPDCAEYGHFKTGTNAPGITFSIQTFSAKLNAAVATALGTFCLSLIGFVESEGAVQVAGFADRLWTINNLIPAIGAFISLPILWRYKLRDKDVQIMTKCNAGEISREEAEKQLSIRI